MQNITSMVNDFDGDIFWVPNRESYVIFDKNNNVLDYGHLETNTVEKAVQVTQQVVTNWKNNSATTVA